jgi:multiple sugar transport system permease protein
MIMIIFPFFWLLVTSFKPDQYILVSSNIIPPSFTLSHYQTAISGGIFTNFRNSLVVALITTIIAVSVSSGAGYALTRFAFRGKGVIGWWVAVSYLMPSIVLVYPLYLFLAQIRLVNTLLGLIMTYLSFAVPFCIWYLRGFFLGIPIDVEEAALLDGCDHYQALLKIVLPVTLPGIVAVGTIVFMLCWNELLFAITLINSEAIKTIPGALAGFIIVGGGHERLDWGLMAASSVVASVPPMILFVFIRRYLVAGLSPGAVKG